MRRALVTGATGGLGLALVEALAGDGYRIRAAGRSHSAEARLRSMGAEAVFGDIRDPAFSAEAVRDIDVVFHAAALSSPWGDPRLFRAINVDATRHLLAAARAAGADSFVFVSSPSVYARPKDQLNLTESTPLPPRFANAYAATKHAAEVLVLAADAPGFATVAIRPRALIGPDDQVLLPRILRIARRGRVPMFRGGRALLDLTDVRDAATALVAADRYRVRAHGLAINISGGAPQPVRQILDTVFAALDLKPRLVPAPYALTASVAGVMEAVCNLLPGRPEPPATVYSLGTLAFSQTFDLARAREVLGYAPRFTPQDAIARTAEAWRTR